MAQNKMSYLNKSINEFVFKQYKTKSNKSNEVVLWGEFFSFAPEEIYKLYRWYGWELMKVSTNIVLNREFSWKERKKTGNSFLAGNASHNSTD